MYTFLFGSDTRAPVLLPLRSSKTFILITVATAIFTDIFIYAIIVPILPFALTSRAHIDPSSTQTWISIFLAEYGAALLIAAPICGWIADRTASRRWPMLLGLISLQGSTVMLCLGRSISVLAVARVLQGISGAVVFIVGLALVVDTVGVEGVGEAMGYMGLSVSLAILLAPLLGGIVFAKAGYFAVYAMAFGLIGLDIFLRIFMVEKKIASRWQESQSTGTEGAQTSGSIEISSERIVEKGTTMISTETVVEVTVNAQKERLDDIGTNDTRLDGHLSPSDEKSSTRLPPIVSLLASRRLLSALWCCTVVSALQTALDAVLPIFVRDTFHWDSIGAGLIFIPVFVVTFLGPVIGKLSDKYGPRWFVTAGTTIGCPGFILLRLVQEDSMEQKVLLCALLAMIGLSLQLVMTPLMAEITYAVEAKTRRRPPGYYGKNGAYAQAYGLFNIAWAAGSMIGPLLGGLTKGSGGWGTSTLVLGCMSMLTTIPAAIWTGESIFKRRKNMNAQTA